MIVVEYGMCIGLCIMVNAMLFGNALTPERIGVYLFGIGVFLMFTHRNKEKTP